jgi:hypothetical protein
MRKMGRKGPPERSVGPIPDRRLVAHQQAATCIDQGKKITKLGITGGAALAPLVMVKESFHG